LTRLNVGWIDFDQFIDNTLMQAELHCQILEILVGMLFAEQRLESLIKAHHLIFINKVVALLHHKAQQVIKSSDLSQSALG
jgi:hypothetical protein